MRIAPPACLSAFAGLALTAAAALAQPVLKGDVGIAPVQGFGRIVLSFPEPVAATARTTGGIVIVRFERPVQLPAERLAQGMPALVVAARMDPDRRILRIALAQGARADLKDAAEDLYLDLVPEAWSGPPPPLPREVVARLAQRLRARVASPASAVTTRAATAPVGVTVARAPFRLRLTFALPPEAGAETEQRGSRVVVAFRGASLDAVGMAAALAGSVAAPAVDAAQRLAFTIEEGATIRAAQVDGAFVVDIWAPGAPRSEGAPEQLGAPAATPRTAGADAPATAHPPTTPESADTPGLFVAHGHLDAAEFALRRRGDGRDAANALLAAAADAPRRERSKPRADLAVFQLARRNAAEAAGILDVIAADDPKSGAAPRHRVLRATAAFMAGDDAGAWAILSDKKLLFDAEAGLLRSALDARGGRLDRALAGFRELAPGLDALPETLQGLLRPLAVEAALAGDATEFAAGQVAALERLDADDRAPELVALLQGALAEARGQAGEALRRYAAAAGSRPVEAEARLRAAMLRHAAGQATSADLRRALETIAMIWRRGAVEVRAQARLADLAAGEGRWRDAFLAMRRAVEILPEHPVTRSVQDDMTRRFEALFLGEEAGNLPKIEALAIFDEFRALIPPGAKGDAIVRRLSERLVDLDLVPQAAELLSHQVEHRLKGVARAEAAARLALLRLMDGKAQQALDVLRASRHAAVPAELRQARLHLEARALSELGGVDLALDMLGAEQGPETERLRAEFLWQARRWSEAAEAFERALGERWRQAEPLQADERRDLLRAGIAHVLAGDRLGSDRLRGRFLHKMEGTPDADLFRLVAIEHQARPGDFGEAARRAVSAGTLADFIAAYRKRFAGPAAPARSG